MLRTSINREIHISGKGEIEQQQKQHGGRPTGQKAVHEAQNSNLIEQPTTQAQEESNAGACQALPADDAALRYRRISMQAKIELGLSRGARTAPKGHMAEKQENTAAPGQKSPSQGAHRSINHTLLVRRRRRGVVVATSRDAVVLDVSLPLVEVQIRGRMRHIGRQPALATMLPCRITL